jgi:hypothetical protein
MDINTVFSILGLGLATHMIYNSYNKHEIKEDFLGGLPPMRTKVIKEAVNSNNQLYSIPGTYQASLSPRFSNLDYGANIRYNMPSVNHQGVPPNNPIGYGNVIRQENYTSSDGVVSGCNQNTTGMPSNFTASNYAQQMQQNSFTPTTNMLPAQQNGQQNMVVNALGESEVQPVVYDRFIYANQKSRLYGQQDFIRGSIPIIPQPPGWFRPSVQPQIDLNPGALAVMGGIGNSTNQELLALQNAASGGTLNVGSGINYAVQHSNYLGSAGGDIKTTAFP